MNSVLVIVGSGALAGGFAILAAAIAERSMPWFTPTAECDARFRAWFWSVLLLSWPVFAWLGWPS